MIGVKIDDREMIGTGDSGSGRDCCRTGDPWAGGIGIGGERAWGTGGSDNRSNRCRTGDPWAGGIGIGGERAWGTGGSDNRCDCCRTGDSWASGQDGTSGYGCIITSNRGSDCFHIGSCTTCIHSVGCIWADCSDLHSENSSYSEGYCTNE